MSAAIEAQGAEKRSLVAVEDLDVSAEAGEILGVLGPNGAGKTTAIRVLTTICAPTRGSFEVAGVRLGERGGSLISTYSRGMRQRLGIARALVNEPRVVFLDEPTLGLDPAGQRQVLGMVRRIADERGATVLLGMHLLAEVEETCSRVLILNRGRAVTQGTSPRSPWRRLRAAGGSASLRTASTRRSRPLPT